MAQPTYRDSVMVVRARSQAATRGVVEFGGRRFTCALGRGGRRARKREGDGATPIGTWMLRQVLYRRDRVLRPRTGLSVRAIRRDDGWCDEPSDRNYNRAVLLPYGGRTEALWRNDAVYDLVIVLSHNERPRERGRGSAIFMHLARRGYPATEGCIALSARDLRHVLACCRAGARIVVAR